MTFFSLIKSYRYKIIIALILIFSANILSLAMPWGIKIIIDNVFNNELKKILNPLIIGLTCILLLQVTLNFLRKINTNIIGEKIICGLREKLYVHIQKISLLSIKKISVPQILTRFSQDIESIRKFIIGDFVESIYALLSTIFIIIILLTINKRLAVISFLVLPFFIFSYFNLLPALKKGYRDFKNINGKMISRINEVLNGMSVVHIFNGHNYENMLFSGFQKDILSASFKNHSLNTGLWAIIEVFTSLSFIGILWIGSTEVISGSMSVGELVAFYSYLGMLFTPIIRLVIMNGSLQEASAALGRINEIMIIEENICQKNIIYVKQIQGSVEFKKVVFGFSEKPVLKDISFSIKKGEKIGIAGPSGAGKTTLMNLLLRFLNPSSGDILVDGHNLANMDINCYRDNISYVQQDDFIFNGTIQENICYGSFNAKYEEMIKYSKIAQAHDFIMRMDKGYQTQVGDRGTRLSMGQRQRISIARALLRNPSILILDEATSSLDSITENMIQEEMCKTFKNKSIFIVAHRFSSIMEADKIIVLNNGIIVEEGDHNNLLKKKGFYSKLYCEQFKNEDSLYINT